MGCKYRSVDDNGVPMCHIQYDPRGFSGISLVERRQCTCLRVSISMMRSKASSCAGIIQMSPFPCLPLALCGDNAIM